MDKLAPSRSDRPFDRSRSTILRPLLPTDYDWCQTLLSDPTVSPRTRLRGAAISCEELPRFLWTGVTTQYIVVSAQNSSRLGLVTLYKADFRALVGFISAMFEPITHRSGAPAEAVILFVDYCFSQLSLRKIYVETIRPNLAQFGGILRRLFVEEGVLREYELYGNEYVDVILASLDRARWQRIRSSFLRAAGAGHLRAYT